MATGMLAAMGATSELTVSGWLVGRRRHKSVIFVDIRHQDGVHQFVARADRMTQEEYRELGRMPHWKAHSSSSICV